MKKLLFSLFALTFLFSVNAQITTPAPSPLSKVEQKVGLTDVMLEYSRPSMKGRTIFGNLVPYGKLWRTGANMRSKITFSTDATIDGQTLKAGSYSIFTIPNVQSWDVIFYNDGEEYGTPNDLVAEHIAAKTTVQVTTVPLLVETFTIDINNITNTGASINFIWENTTVQVPFSLPTDAAVVASINTTLNGPSVNDYFNSASYYFQEGKDINKAKEWIDKAIDMSKDKPRFWILRTQSLIHAKAGNMAGAIAAAKKSLAGAEAAGNDDYIKMNTDSLKEWGAK